MFTPQQLKRIARTIENLGRQTLDKHQHEVVATLFSEDLKIKDEQRKEFLEWCGIKEQQ